MMGSIPQSPTKIRPGSRDTGFPAQFCGNRNTTLPHPDADLSPNACITAEDVSVNKLLHRSRRSFLARHKRTISHGKIMPGTTALEQMYSDPALLESDEAESPGHEEKGNPMLALSDGRPSKDGGDSFGSSSMHGGDDDTGKGLHPPEVQKRQSVLRKLRLHK